MQGHWTVTNIWSSVGGRFTVLLIYRPECIAGLDCAARDCNFWLAFQFTTFLAFLAFSIVVRCHLHPIHDLNLTLFYRCTSHACLICEYCWITVSHRRPVLLEKCKSSAVVQGQWSDVQVYNDSVSLSDTLSFIIHLYTDEYWSLSSCSSQLHVWRMSATGWQSQLVTAQCVQDSGSLAQLWSSARSTSVHSHITVVSTVVPLSAAARHYHAETVCHSFATICTIKSNTRIFLIANHQPPF